MPAAIMMTFHVHSFLGMVSPAPRVMSTPTNISVAFTSHLGRGGQPPLDNVKARPAKLHDIAGVELQDQNARPCDTPYPGLYDLLAHEERGPFICDLPGGGIIHPVHHIHSCVLRKR